MPGDRMPGMPAVAPLAASSEASTTDRRWSNDSEVYSPVPPSGTMPRLPASTMRRTWALNGRGSTCRAEVSGGGAAVRMPAYLWVTFMGGRWVEVGGGSSGQAQAIPSRCAEHKWRTTSLFQHLPLLSSASGALINPTRIGVETHQSQSSARWRHAYFPCVRGRQKGKGPQRARLLEAAKAQRPRGGARASLTTRGEVERSRFIHEPALSLVPLARPPPKGGWPTIAPVGLSLRERLAAPCHNTSSPPFGAA